MARMGSIINHRVDYNEVGALGGSAYPNTTHLPGIWRKIEKLVEGGRGGGGCTVDILTLAFARRTNIPSKKIPSSGPPQIPKML